MLLGLSSEAAGVEVDLASVNGNVGAAVSYGAELSAFAEAAWRRDETLDGARSQLLAAVGEAALIEAAQTAAIFRSLNIAADSSGIALDENWRDQARDFVAELSFDRFATAANTPGF